MNLVAGSVKTGVLHVGDAVVSAVPTDDGPVTVGFRPEHLRMHGQYSQGQVPARVDFVEPLGSHVLVTALVDTGSSESTRVVIQAPAGTDHETGTQIGLELTPERTYFFDAETGAVRARREHASL
jgi:sn-glycerol 3-phosphate transport system ATP-binding protein